MTAFLLAHQPAGLDLGLRQQRIHQRGLADARLADQHAHRAGEQRRAARRVPSPILAEQVTCAYPAAAYASSSAASILLAARSDLLTATAPAIPAAVAAHR